MAPDEATQKNAPGTHDLAGGPVNRSGPSLAHSSPPNGIFKAVLAPVQTFLRLEAAGGIVLVGCAALALVWANFEHQSYRSVFDFSMELRLGGVVIGFTLHQLVNDGLMTLFFFVVGMEIKRELTQGELRTASQALLPAVAALGGMAVPAGVFLAFNAGHPGAPGWGIPMATDIAFCIGVLTLLRSRVPHSLIIFVTALAIFDDIGGILVIALFYGGGIHLPWLAAAVAVSLGVAALARAHVRTPLVWGIAGVLLWYTLHHSGIHATIAGVVLGLLMPSHPQAEPRQILKELAARAAVLAGQADAQGSDDAAVLGLEKRLEELESPVTRYVRALHPWVAFVIMPIFALANSGVHLAGLEASQMFDRVTLGTAAALLLGKPAGIVAFTLGAVWLGGARLPTGTSFPKLVGAAIVAGIGFTVALFIAGLAYPRANALLDQAKVGILAGSLLSGIVGALVLLRTRRESPAYQQEAAET